MFNNKNILVTGGTGSFGKRFIETLLQKYKLKKIAVYSRDELKQSQMIEYLSNKFDIKNLRFFIGDVRDRERLTMAMEGMNFVVHAAFPWFSIFTDCFKFGYNAFLKGAIPKR